MPRVLGIDPGTVSIDLCGLADGELWLDRSFPTTDALADPAAFVALLRQGGIPDLIAGPSGYGLPLLRADQATDADLQLAYLHRPGDAGGIGGLTRFARLLIQSGLPVVFTPGVIHLPTVPPQRKLNRVDLGTADKVAVAALGIWDQARRLDRGDPLGRPYHPPGRRSFILLELGGAFTAAVAVEHGAIIDGVGGSSGPMGWHSSGAWDGEVAYLAGTVTKEMLFAGGRDADRQHGLAGYIEAAHKAVLQLTAALPQPGEILLSGRHNRDPEVRGALERRLSAIAPVRELEGFARIAKQGAQGAAILADGLAGGQHRALVEQLGIRDADGTALDYLRVITPQQARQSLGLR